MVSARKKSILKDVAAIAAGGFLEIVVENIGDNIANQSTGDLLGAAEAAALAAFGVYKDNHYATMVGAGGLAVAVPNLVGKAVMGSYTLVPRLGMSMGMGYTGGKYGNAAPINGPVGAYLKYQPNYYSRR